MRDLGASFSHSEDGGGFQLPSGSKFVFGLSRTRMQISARYPKGARLEHFSSLVTVLLFYGYKFGAESSYIRKQFKTYPAYIARRSVFKSAE